MLEAEVFLVGQKAVTWVLSADGPRILAKEGEGGDLTLVYEDEEAKAMLPGVLKP